MINEIRPFEEFKEKYEELKNNPMYQNYCSVLENKDKVIKKLQEENQRLKEMKYKTLIDLQDRIDKALKLIKENVKDEYGIIDVSTVWEVERVLEGVKDVKD